MNEETKTEIAETANVGKGGMAARELHDWVEMFLRALCAVILVFTLLFRVVTVSGNSMRETLHDKDRLIVSNLGYTPTNGDIVILRTDMFGDEALVKRVIATEGDTLNIDFVNWAVYVNDEKIDEPYVNFEEGMYMNGINGEKVTLPLTVGKGEMFVMGDNRNHSSDGRAFGVVDIRECIGKVYFRFLPFDSFGKLN